MIYQNQMTFMSNPNETEPHVHFEPYIVGIENETSLANETTEIQLDKNVYGIKEARDSIMRKFVEFLPKSYLLSELFDMYDSLFYNIPLRGRKSHINIIRKSSKYAGVPLNPSLEEIENLRNQIETLKDDIDSIENEHPFIPNFTVIRNRNTDTLNYYMQSGRKRIINDIKILKVLKLQSGTPPNTPNSEFVILLNSQAIGGIVSGPPINTLEDLNVDIKEINRYNIPIITYEDDEA